MTPTISRAPDAGQDPSALASPPTHRVVQVIELLSRRPTEQLSLARIVRHTGLSRATAHAVLTQLTADGWTVRDDDGAYGLGLRLLTVARRAEAAFPLPRLALGTLRELARRHGFPVFLAERDGDAIAITEVVGTPSVPWIRQGRRLPLAPPVAREFIAWAPDSEQRAWLDRADPAHRDRLVTVLDAVRHRGYSVERLADIWRAHRGGLHHPLRLPLPGRVAAAYRAGYNTCPDNGDGIQTWAQYLATHPETGYRLRR
ncbi:IclR family transcriptional regulator [Nocardia terpenica]|uniref:IclR family transcriptional regulator n=1 Tax=Nocardia terpenica TaxID=455432 RepID=UPI000A643F9A|nr:helix-turn-helix domain-containing protein [Nocardia terpenica]